MSATEAGYGSSLPERKSSAIDTMPCDAMASWRSRSVKRLLRHHAPPWHSTSVGNGPSPRGLNAGEQRLIAVAEILDVLHAESMRLGFQDCSGHGEPPMHEIEL